MLQINISPTSGVLENHRVGVHQVLYIGTVRMMEDEEVEDREEDEESLGEEEGEGGGGGEGNWRSEREGMTRTMKGKVHPPPT